MLFAFAEVVGGDRAVPVLPGAGGNPRPAFERASWAAFWAALAVTGRETGASSPSPDPLDQEMTDRCQVTRHGDPLGNDYSPFGRTTVRRSWPHCPAPGPVFRCTVWPGQPADPNGTPCGYHSILFSLDRTFP